MHVMLRDTFPTKVLFDNAFGALSVNSPWERSSRFIPRADIIEADEHLEIVFEAPGVAKKDLKISVEDRTLTISGERTRSTEGRRLTSEIAYGAFKRSFLLPKTADAESIKANYEDGVLRITVAKTKEARPRMIEIK